jgi:hypothetical protein
MTDHLAGGGEHRSPKIRRVRRDRQLPSHDSITSVSVYCIKTSHRVSGERFIPVSFVKRALYQRKRRPPVIAQLSFARKPLSRPPFSREYSVPMQVSHFGANLQSSRTETASSEPWHEDRAVVARAHVPPALLAALHDIRRSELKARRREAHQSPPHGAAWISGALGPTRRRAWPGPLGRGACRCGLIPGHPHTGHKEPGHLGQGRPALRTCLSLHCRIGHYADRRCIAATPGSLARLSRRPADLSAHQPALFPGASQR